MAILVTRPAPDNKATAAVLKSAGYDVLLSPALRFESLPFYDDHNAKYDAVVVTSANALRGVENHGILERLRDVPLFAVGDASAEIASKHGFRNVLSASGDGGALRDLVSKKLKRGATLCYLAGADLGRDLTGELGELGFTVITHTTYRMIPIPDFSDEIKSAFAAGTIGAVLHYSRRSARTFVKAVKSAGIEIAALALPQCCMSEGVAVVLREAGASSVSVAQKPDEPSLMATLRLCLAPQRATT